MLMDAPFANGVPNVTVPDDHVELNAPPLGCDGGCSNVVPCTFTVQGVSGKEDAHDLVQRQRVDRDADDDIRFARAQTRFSN